MSDPELSQHLIRKQNDEGETIVVYRRVSFDVNQQTVTLHFPIEPALSNIPNAESMLLTDSLQMNETDEGLSTIEEMISSARIKIDPPKKFGIRAEISLSHPTPAGFSVLLETVIQSKR